MYTYLYTFVLCRVLSRWHVIRENVIIGWTTDVGYLASECIQISGSRDGELFVIGSGWEVGTISRIFVNERGTVWFVLPGRGLLVVQYGSPLTGLPPASCVTQTAVSGSAV